MCNLTLQKLPNGDVSAIGTLDRMVPGNKGEGWTLTVHSSTPLRGVQLVEMGDQEKGYEGNKLNGIYDGTGGSETLNAV